MQSASRRLVAAAALVAAGTLLACAERPAGRLAAARHVPPEVAAAYAEPGPVPEATLCIHARRPDLETWDVVLPARFRADAAPEARQPVRMRWWRPLPVDEPRPAVVLSPILGSESALVADFALEFARRGWHALVVEREEVSVDASRPIGQVEERLHACVSHQVQALDWLLGHTDVDARRVGSLGISAGGIQNAMVAGVDPRYAAHVIALAGGPLADVFVDSGERKLRRLACDGMRREGIDKETLRERLRAVIRTDPVALAANVDPASVLLVIARNDQSVPTRYGERLREALGDPETIVLPFGHYGSVLSLPLVHARALAFLERRFAAGPAAVPSAPRSAPP